MSTTGTTLPKATPQQTLAAITALVTVVEKLIAGISADISDPLNLLNFSADLAIVSEAKQAYAGAKVVIADLKAQL